MERNRYYCHKLGVILAITVAIVVHSCQSSETNIEKSVLTLIGKEFKWDDSYKIEIQETPVTLDWDNTDFKIITIVDSSDCISCKMKLEAWDNLINELKCIKGIDIDFIMIIEHEKTKLLSATIHTRDFCLPVFFDETTSFRNTNEINISSTINTFLLDSDNRVIAIGNPILNPKVKRLYTNLISEDATTNSFYDNSVIEGEKSRNIGVIKPYSTNNEVFTLKNISDDTLTVESIIPSCDCVKGICSAPTIAPSKEFDIQVTIQPDSLSGFFTQSLNLFFNELNYATEITIHGYNIGL